MLESICKMIKGFASFDEEGGVTCILNTEAYQGFIDLVRNIYGDHAAEVVESQWSEHPGNLMVCDQLRYPEDYEEAFRLCLTGKG